MTTTLAFNDLMVESTAFKAYSSDLQYGHHWPRKNETTNGPCARSAPEETNLPSWFAKLNRGAAVPIAGRF
jgi:hypothetical protein